MVLMLLIMQVPTEFVNIETVVSLISAEFFKTCCPMMITSLPAVINAPGLYCVCETLSYAAGPAITISVNNVSLDLKQNLLQRTTANTIGTGQAIVCSGSNCIIENGLIDSDGIVVSGANVTVRDITITTTTPPTAAMSLINFQAASSAGIVEECVVQGQGADDLLVLGIQVTGPNASVSNCEVTGCNIGFVLDTTALNTVVNNCQAINNFSDGFLINAPGLVIQECVATFSNGVGSSGIGFSVASDNVQLYDCVATNSAVQGFLLSGNLAFVTGCSAQANGAMVSKSVETEPA